MESSLGSDFELSNFNKIATMSSGAISQPKKWLLGLILSVFCLIMVVTVAVLDSNLKAELEMYKDSVDSLELEVKGPGEEKRVDELRTNIGILTMKSQLVSIVTRLDKMNQVVNKLNKHVEGSLEDTEKRLDKFFRETNLTLCSHDTISVPFSGVFKLEVTATVQGRGLYEKEEVLEVQLNGSVLTGGGRVRIVDISGENKVPCPSTGVASSRQECVELDQKFLMDLSAEDNLSLVTTQGRLLFKKMCLVSTRQGTQLPSGVKSVVVTH